MATDSHGRRIDYLRISAHRPLQPALRLLHAGGGCRVRAARGDADVRGDRALRRVRRLGGHQQDPADRRRAARAPRRGRPRPSPPRDSRTRVHRAHHQRNAAAAVRRAAARGWAFAREHSASTRWTPASTPASRAAASSKTPLPASTLPSRTVFDPVKLNVVVVRSLDPDLLGFAKLTIEPPAARPLHRIHAGRRRRGGLGLPLGHRHRGQRGLDACRHRPERRGHRSDHRGGGGRGSRRAHGRRPEGRSRRMGTGELLPAPRRARHGRRHLAALSPLLRRVQPPAPDRRRPPAPLSLLGPRARRPERACAPAPTRTFELSSARHSPTSPKATTCASAPPAACPRSEDDRWCREPRQAHTPR